MSKFPPTVQEQEGWHGETGESVTFYVTDPWGAEIDYSDVPDGSNWFFGMGLGRSYSKVTSQILSELSDVVCAHEDNRVFSLLGLLTSRRIVSRQMPLISWNNRPGSVASAKEIRGYCEVWRETIGGQGFLTGDVGNKYFDIRHILRKVFPGGKFIYTLRNPLDQLASNLRFGGSIKFHEDLGPEEQVQQALHLWGWINTFIQRYHAVCQEADVFCVPGEAYSDPFIMEPYVDAMAAHIGSSVGFSLTAMGRYIKEDGVGRWKREPRMQAVIKTLRDAKLLPEAELERLDVPGIDYVPLIGIDTWRAA